jgi:hypothetical protein
MSANQTALIRLELGFLNQLLAMAMQSAVIGDTDDVLTDLERARTVVERISVLVPKLLPKTEAA